MEAETIGFGFHEINLRVIGRWAADERQRIVTEVTVIVISNR
jgi:hypothetical protein